MATKGESIFNLDLNDLIEEAFERAGAELRSGYDFRTARRSLNDELYVSRNLYEALTQHVQMLLQQYR